MTWCRLQVLELRLDSVTEIVSANAAQHLTEFLVFQGRLCLKVESNDTMN